MLYNCFSVKLSIVQLVKLDKKNTCGTILKYILKIALKQLYNNKKLSVFLYKTYISCYKRVYGSLQMHNGSNTLCIKKTTCKKLANFLLGSMILVYNYVLRHLKKVDFHEDFKICFNLIEWPFIMKSWNII